MQFLNNIMSTYFFRPILHRNQNPFKTTKVDEVGLDQQQQQKLTSGAAGDFDVKIVLKPPASEPHEVDNETIIKTLDSEIAESKADIRHLQGHIYNAEEQLPERWKICEILKKSCEEHTQMVANEINKCDKRNDRFDEEIRKLNARLRSWQEVIDRAKAVQIVETDFHE